MQVLKPFKYIGLNGLGQRVSGTLRAVTQAEALQQLHIQGFVEVQWVFRKTFNWKALSKRFSFRVALKERIDLVQRLGVLLQSGLPLLEALRLLQRQTTPKRLRYLLEALQTQVRAGQAFSEGLMRVEPFFGSLGIAMIQAAEARGALAEALLALAQLWRKQLSQVRTLQSLLVYPCVVLSLGLAVLSFLSLWVLPRFEAVFASSLGNVPLPTLTRWVLAFPKNAPLLGLLSAALLLFIVWLLRFSPKHWAVAPRLGRCLPGLRAALEDRMLARLGSSLGALLGAGVPILKGISLTAQQLPAYPYRPALLQVSTQIKNGNRLSLGLKQTRCFPEALIHISEVGEATGRLPEMLQLLGQDAAESFDSKVTRAVQLLEPALLLLLALLVLILALALVLPMSRLLEGA